MTRTALLLVTLLAALGCNDDITGLGPPSDPATETFAASLGVNIAQMSKTAAGVYYQDIVVGPATAPLISDSTTVVIVTYAGYLKDGKLFDSGIGKSFAPSDLIPGFRNGLKGMREGGKRKLVIPSALGYGGRSIKNADNSIRIPRQSTLVFDVDVLKVTNPAPTGTTP